MAKGSARKKKGDHGAAGHNIDQADKDKAILKCAKDQKALDHEKETTQAEWRERHKGITAKLRLVEVSRGAFQTEYVPWKKKQDADSDADQRKAERDEVVYRDECRRVHSALNEGAQLDMLDIQARADKARVEQKTEANGAKHTEMEA